MNSPKAKTPSSLLSFIMTAQNKTNEQGKQKETRNLEDFIEKKNQEILGKKKRKGQTLDGPSIV